MAGACQGAVLKASSRGAAENGLKFNLRPDARVSRSLICKKL